MKKTILLIAFVVFLMNSYAQNSFKDLRDNTTYRTILVGDIMWMAENLKFETTTGASYFDDDPDNRYPYGVLYDWTTATKACPDGWHLPTGNEFKELIDYYDKTIGLEKIVGDTNTVNFQFGGMINFEGTDSEIDESGYYWTSTDYDSKYAQYFGYMIILNNHVIDLSRQEDNEDVHGSEKTSRYSVRCVKKL